ncbi:unnamed protein product [Symbiodinium natans]|uniref:GDT1 family protein n=1 Tax=Symbiodinium natans TaxID=878477 RepID=A0A812K0S6_9DINO|nr:unnamed protein product [Symbiodinium natans]
MPTLLHWCAGVGAAISIKISSSIDDVVWLAPFLTNNVSYFSRLKNISIYVIVCWVQTALAMCIAYSGNKIVEMLTRNSKDAWSSEKILTVMAGSMLALYSIKLIYEYATETEEEEQDTKEDAGQENKYAKVRPSDLEGGGELTPGRNESRQLYSARNRPIESPNAASDQERRMLDDKESAQTQTLFVIAFIGSLDDLTLFVPMLVGKGFDFAQLTIGALTAASLIVIICLFVGLCQPVADCISRIPLFAIVVAFATLLLVKSFTME